MKAVLTYPTLRSLGVVFAILPGVAILASGPERDRARTGSVNLNFVRSCSFPLVTRF
jgi:hypothetical protein